MKDQVQLERIFFPKGSPPPPLEQRRWKVDPTNPACPYHSFVGNAKAKKRLARISCAALENFNHCCRELAIALIGPPSTGKTTLAYRHAQVLNLPFVKLTPAMLPNADALFNHVAQVCKDAGMPLVEVKREGHYIFPPIVIFIDEIHDLNPKLSRGPLLKAVEFDDHLLATESGKTADTYNVHWVIATTDRGELFDAFDTRFVKVPLSLYDKDEMAEIVLSANPELGEEAARLVSFYNSRVPREALAFAREMMLEAKMRPGTPWTEVAKIVAEDNDIDSFGMTLQRLRILKALAKQPLSEERLPSVAGCKIKEAKKFVLPALMDFDEGQEPMVTVTSKGFTITRTGLEELDKRGIPHEGNKVAA